MHALNFEDMAATAMALLWALGYFATQVTEMHALNFEDMAANGCAMNNADEVLGRAHNNATCSPCCSLSQHIAVWRGNQPIFLPFVLGHSLIAPQFLNNDGIVAGELSGSRAAIWTPSGETFVGQKLGSLAGMTAINVKRIDNIGCTAGWATGGFFPLVVFPVLWDGTTWVDLTALGFPNQGPLAISPAEHVATEGFSCHLGNVNGIVEVPEAP